ERANAPTARSISLASRTLTGFTTTPSDGAADWIAPNIPIPTVIAGSRMTAARVIPGAISLSSSSHLPVKAVLVRNEPSRVTARPRQTVDEACADGIADQHKHDWHGGGRL